MNPKRGELYCLKTSPPQKPRPIVIVSREPLNGGDAVLAVPFYSQQLQKRAAQDWCEMFYAGEGGLHYDCVAKTDELSLIEKVRIDLASGPIGKFNDAQMRRLIGAIKWSLGIDPPLE